MQNQIINMCRVLIGPNAVVTDDQINDAIERVSLIFPNMDIAQVKSELLSLYGVRIQDFQILEGNERRQPWLRDFKAERKSTWDFWVRYKQYLSEQKGFAPLVIQKLDEMSDRILDNLFNPQLTNITIDKKGLVVGQVQSGKTANYTGLICKAADAGFNFIVVLAGILNNLRSQTQSRKKADWSDIEENASGGQGNVSGLEGIIRTLNYWSDTNSYGHAVFNPFGVP